LDGSIDASYPPETETTGCRSEARATLSEIYGWFTDGFDTADLKDAKALLNGVGRVAHFCKTNDLFRVPLAHRLDDLA
jgi:hypothetical protein